MDNTRYVHEGKSTRWGYFWIAMTIIMVFAIAVLGLAYGNTLTREEENQRYAIVSARGGEPVCIGPDGVYVKYPSLQQTPGETS